MKYFVGFVLYGLLGFLLGFSGVGVLEKPVEFFAILLTVLVIDVSSYYSGFKRV